MAQLAPARLDAPVLACPGWDVAEVMRHTAAVYAHKVAIIRLGRNPEPGAWHSSPPAGASLLEWFDDTRTALIDELAAQDPDNWAHTWWPPDQTMGFWYRRMALETVVHRVDVESAAAGDLSALDAELCTEGIDEVLTVFLGVHDGGAGAAERPGAISLVAGGREWTVHLEPNAVRVERGARGATAAHLQGDAAPMFLYLWGRGPVGVLDAQGDLVLVQQLRRRLAVATQ